MSAFRTTAKVDPGGVLTLLGLPFAAGANVRVTIETRPAVQNDASSVEGLHPALQEMVGILPAELDVEQEIHQHRLTKHA